MQVMPVKTKTRCFAEKHLPGALINPECICNDEIPAIHPIVFNELEAKCIRSSAIKTAGPSGLDAVEWKQLLSLRQGIR